MDKQTVLLAEQVGIFLLPTIRQMVEVKIGEIRAEVLAKIEASASNAEGALSRVDEVKQCLEKEWGEFSGGIETSIKEILSTVENTKIEVLGVVSTKCDAIAGATAEARKIGVSASQIADEALAGTQGLFQNVSELKEAVSNADMAILATVGKHSEELDSISTRVAGAVNSFSSWKETIQVDLGAAKEAIGEFPKLLSDVASEITSEKVSIKAVVQLANTTAEELEKVASLVSDNSVALDSAVSYVKDLSEKLDSGTAATLENIGAVENKISAAVEKTRGEIAVLENKFLEQAELVSGLEKSLDAVNSDVRVLKEVDASTASMVDVLSKNLAEAVSTLTKEIAVVTSDVTSLRDFSEKYSDSISKLVETLSEKVAGVETATSKAAELHEVFQKCFKTMGDNVSSISENLSKEQSLLHKKIEEFSAEIPVISETIKRLHSIHKKLGEVDTAIELGSAAVSSIEKTLLSSVEKLDGLSETVDKLTNEVSQFPAELSEVANSAATREALNRDIFEQHRVESVKRFESISESFDAVCKDVLSFRLDVRRVEEGTGVLLEQINQVGASIAEIDGRVTSTENRKDYGEEITKLQKVLADLSRAGIEVRHVLDEVTAIATEARSLSLETAQLTKEELAGVEASLAADAGARTAERALQSEQFRSIAVEHVSKTVSELRKELVPSMLEAVRANVAALPKAKDGTNGRDGEFGPVQKFIEGEIYRPPTLVSHLGGVWQATSPTKAPPAANSPDWRCIVVGLSGASLDTSDDIRQVTLAVALSDGTEVRRSARVPSMVYKGIYSEDGIYDLQDVVTHSGSLWIAMAEKDLGVPGTDGSYWKLAVKRGQDGKHSKDVVVQMPAPPQAVIGFRGEYVEDLVYHANSVVTYAGSVWLSKKDTKARPPYLTGQEDDNWLKL